MLYLRLGQPLSPSVWMSLHWSSVPYPMIMAPMKALQMFYPTAATAARKWDGWMYGRASKHHHHHKCVFWRNHEWLLAALRQRRLPFNNSQIRFAGVFPAALWYSLANMLDFYFCYGISSDAINFVMFVTQSPRVHRTGSFFLYDDISHTDIAKCNVFGSVRLYLP